MLFYITMFIVCVIAALGFLFLYRSLGDIGKIFFSAFLPTYGKKKAPGPPKVRTLAKSVNDTPTPWGWEGNAKRTKKATRARTAAPYNGQTGGWKGNQANTRVNGGAVGGMGSALDQRAKEAEPEKIVHPNVGWPYREEKVTLANRDDKVPRKAAPKPKPTDLSKTSKPWGW